MIEIINNFFMRATVLLIKRESSYQKKTYMNGEKDKC